MDALSDVLSLMKPRSYASGGLDVGGNWCIQYPVNRGIKCYALDSGECWLQVEGVEDAVHLQAGDCFLLPSGRPFRLASDLSLPPFDARILYATPLNGGVVSHQGGGDCFFVGGYFVLSGDHVGMLLGMLPPIVHIRGESKKASLRWCLDRMRQELQEREPGDSLAIQQLAYMMLIQALRLHLAHEPKGGVGWLFALADKQMNAALNAMHGDPARRWTLEMLAERAGMSRTTFALRFREVVGLPAMDYLTRWRMMLAGDRLQTSDDSISIIAPALGYESESAFSTAFKRIMGCSPRQYSRRNVAPVTGTKRERRLPGKGQRQPPLAAYSLV